MQGESGDKKTPKEDDDDMSGTKKEELTEKGKWGRAEREAGNPLNFAESCIELMHRS